MTPPQLPAYDHHPQPYTGPTIEEVLALRKEFLSPALLTYYQHPIMIVEGSRQYVYDEKGRRYLDAFGGIVTISVGHSHPYVLQKAREQMEVLQHTTTIYLHPVVAEYGRELAAKMPGSLKVCYFVNSGSEANDLALLMARIHTGNYDVIALRNAYHGGVASSLGLTAHSTWKYNVPHSFGIHHALNPDPYRGPWPREDPEAGAKYAADVHNLIDHATPGRVAAYFAESIQGVGGAVVYPDGYLVGCMKPFDRPAGYASPMRCRPASAAPETTTGGLRTRGSSRISSPWPKGSATGPRWPPWSPPRKSPNHSPSGITSTPSAATRFPVPWAGRSWKLSTGKTCSRIPWKWERFLWTA